MGRALLLHQRRMFAALPFSSSSCLEPYRQGHCIYCFFVFDQLVKSHAVSLYFVYKPSKQEGRQQEYSQYKPIHHTNTRGGAISAMRGV